MALWEHQNGSHDKETLASASQGNHDCKLSAINAQQQLLTKEFCIA